MLPRLHLAHLPTPIVRPRRLAEKLGVDLWIKRDDATLGPEAGNKIRKLEYLLADAVQLGADTLITCGGVQSNHARATALLGASLGLSSVLALRTVEPDLDASHLALSGNVLLDKLVGAEIRLITPAQYRERTALMAGIAEELRSRGKKPYVIPEGGSNGLGAIGYVEAMREVRAQLDVGLAGGKPFDLIVFACGSGGTAAGLALGARHHGVADEVRAMAVCDDAPTFERVIARIVEEAQEIDPRLTETAKLVVDDSAKGPAYAIANTAQKQRIVEVARLSGLVLDPVYTGKAFAGLWEMAERGELTHKRVLFIHTGGAPGLLAQGAMFDGLV